MKIFLANPMGFCAGVDRAIKIVDRVLELYQGIPVFVHHEIVHNQFVVRSLEARGVRFVESLDEVPDGAVLIFSAHGVSKAIKEAAEKRSLHLLLDATCPLVTKIHLEVMAIAKKGHDCILIGHKGHAEVAGTLGHFDDRYGGKNYLIGSQEEANALIVAQPERLFYVTQTTLSVEETREIVRTLKQRFPKIEGPKKDDICYATQNRQDALRHLITQCHLMLVVGSSHSSNTRRLVEISEQSDRATYLISTSDELNEQWFFPEARIGITAGASTPDMLVRQVIARLQAIASDRNEPFEWVIANASVQENLKFSLPEILRTDILRS